MVSNLTKCFFPYLNPKSYLNVLQALAKFQLISAYGKTFSKTEKYKIFKEFIDIHKVI